MKNIFLISLIFCLFHFQLKASTDSLPNDYNQDSVEMRSDSADVSTENNSDISAESNYDYNQLFMFGFLILGAMLVVWKFKNND